ncbi:MAG TPA: hypothetical protein ENI43_04125 [Firmicutes bacterium]|nr:hypothetical protein [Bacillota bacterium]
MMNRYILFAIIIGVIITSGLSKEEGETAAHIDITDYLLGMDGINPPSEDNPFSTKMTCTSSGCHNYEQIICAYHFQQGRSHYLPKNHPCYDENDWGMYSKWCALPNKFVSAGIDPSGETFDDYKYTKSCGICHPGAGPMELDLNGERHTEGGFADNNVVEASCMMCHQQFGYDHLARNKNIVAGRFKIANAAGMGFYDGDGNYTGTHTPFAIGPPTDSNCNNCHGGERYDQLTIVKETKNAYGFDVLFKKPKCDIYKRGFFWCYECDVHFKGGLKCIDCHSAFRGHQIAKGGITDCTQHESLDYAGFLNCSECHSNNNTFGAPVYDHDKFPSDHLEKISCQTCHIPYIEFAAFDYMDWSIGENKVGGAVAWKGGKMKPDEYALGGFSFQDIEGFKPTYAWFNGKSRMDEDGRPYLPGPCDRTDPGAKIMPFNTPVVAWWDVGYEEDSVDSVKITEENRTTTYYHGKPIPTEDIVSAANTIPNFTSDENGNGMFDIGDITDEKMSALTEKIKEKYPHAVLREIPIYFSLSHNVSPAEEALGNSCTDCHAPGSHFFFGKTRVRIGEGADAFIPMYANLNYGLSEVNLHAIRETFVKPFFLWLTLIIIGASLIHIIAFGRKKVYVAEGERPTVIRHGGFQRFIHLLNITSFVMLTITGFSRMFAPNFFADWVFGEMDTMSNWHYIFGAVFTVSIVITFIMWVKDSTFKKEDWKWLKSLGGYLWKTDDIPSHKFNAGQKIYFWLTVIFGLIMIITGITMALMDNPWQFIHSTHAIVASVFVAMVLGHLYLSLLANEKTIRAIFIGTVYKSWAEKFHSLWRYEEKI